MNCGNLGDERGGQKGSDGKDVEEGSDEGGEWLYVNSVVNLGAVGCFASPIYYFDP